MNVLIVGGGGREHAIAAAVSRSDRCDQIFCAPGNAGTAALGRNLPIDVMDSDGLAAAARAHDIGLTIVGPEAPLCAGIVDHFRARNLRIFGPTQAAARIEGDKAYAKRLMRSGDIPTADARSFTDFGAAKAYVATREGALVVKAAGLAAGKGVVICDEPAEAILALERIMVQREFGEAGRCVLIEERLQGRELSVFALVAGKTLYMLDTAQDYKKAGDGDTGPNTGGMGAYSPATGVTSDLFDTVERNILAPIVDVMDREGSAFNGLLYAGLMLTPGGPKVLEFNCRFGDPETQVVLPRIRSGFLEALDAAVDERLDEVELDWDPRPAVTVVMASGGYPGAYQKGKVIEGLSEAAALPDTFVYHAGTRRIEHLTVSDGGRVLAVTALGEDMPAARARAYDAVSRIRFEEAHVRTDIAAGIGDAAATGDGRTPVGGLA